MSRFSIEDTAKPDSLLGKTQQFAEGIFDFAKRGAETFGAVKELFEAEEKVQETLSLRASYARETRFG